MDSLQRCNFKSNQGITNLSLIMENACDGTSENVDNCLGEYSGYDETLNDPDGGGPNPASPIIDKKLKNLIILCRN